MLSFSPSLLLLFFEAKKRNEKAFEKFPVYLSTQMASPAAPSHTATPIFHPTH
jgi:hypothetical protein